MNSTECCNTFEVTRPISPNKNIYSFWEIILTLKCLEKAQLFWTDEEFIQGWFLAYFSVIQGGYSTTLRGIPYFQS